MSFTIVRARREKGSLDGQSLYSLCIDHGDAWIEATLGLFPRSGISSYLPPVTVSFTPCLLSVHSEVLSVVTVLIRN